MPLMKHWLAVIIIVGSLYNSIYYQQIYLQYANSILSLIRISVSGMPETEILILKTIKYRHQTC